MATEFRVARRLEALRGYPFVEIDREVERLRDEGVRILDFGVGDFSDETPGPIRDACRRGVERHRAAGYPSGSGHAGFREAAAHWIGRRFGVRVDPETEVSSTVGSKEAVFHSAWAFLDPGDRVLAPDPGYPPVARGTHFAGGEVAFYPLLESNGFLPDLESIAREDFTRMRAMWISYPNSPTGVVAERAAIDACARFARARGLALLSDEAYVDLHFGGAPPPSALEFGLEGTLAFFSLSKRCAMTSYRVGFVAGDARLVAAFRKLKSNLDSGTPPFVQDAAIEALANDEAAELLRERVRERRDLLVAGLEDAGLSPRIPQGTLYVWQKAPHGIPSLEFFRRLLEPDLAIASIPGEWLCESALAPGRGWVRFSLGAPTADYAEAAERLARHGPVWRP